MDHEKFWELSWFEWSLYARRHKIEMQQIQLIEHNHWARFRIQWADFRNANRSSKDPTVSPKDLIELPFDKEQVSEEPKPPSFKELKAQLGSKFKKDGGAK